MAPMRSSSRRWGEAVRWLITLAVLFFVASPVFAQKRIALTFDDVPRARGAFFTPDERAEKLIASLKAAKVNQAAFFVVPGRLNDPDGAGGEVRIAAYVAAGHVIANHSFSHRQLKDTSAEAYLADIDMAGRFLAGRAGYRPWFRFPYLDEGADDKAKRDAVRAGLTKRNLRNGYVTADGSDWHLEALTVAARKAGRPMDMEALKKLYIQTQMSAVEYHDKLARMTLGRSPAHVLLLHETDLAALFIRDLIDELHRNGWSIISADEAFADPIAKAMPDVPYAYGTLIGSMAWEKDVKPPIWPIWIGTTTTTFLFDQRVTKTPEPK
jgi:peptidoglycan-N-acetylglucosamine deacetylase